MSAPENDPARIERDFLGEVRVPAAALYGAQTARAASWSFTGQRFPLPVVHMLAHLKAAGARVHGAQGRLSSQLAEAIERAALEVAEGCHDAQFVVDLFQTGSATSSNMNVNEVVANRAAILLGEAIGRKKVHPNDHVNLGQSSNDAVPSAVQLAVLHSTVRRLLPALTALVARFRMLGRAHWNDVVDGRTHLMRATPIRLGQRFAGHAAQLALAIAGLEAALAGCRALPLGGTAVGTGVGCPPGFAAAVCLELSRRLDLAVHETPDHLGAQGGVAAIAGLVAAIRNAGTTLYKITNDLRWQASDALREIDVPELQPGSSIMPSKINPVVCEAVLMACAQLLGNDIVVAFANSQGQFELHTMIPLVAHNALESIDLLAGAAEVLEHRCLAGLMVAPGTGDAVVRNPILATALAPEVGYDVAAKIAQRAAREGRSVLEIAREETDLDPAVLERLLDPVRLCGDFGRRGSE